MYRVLPHKSLQSEHLRPTWHRKWPLGPVVGVSCAGSASPTSKKELGKLRRGPWRVLPRPLRWASRPSACRCHRKTCRCPCSPWCQAKVKDPRISSTGGAVEARPVALRTRSWGRHGDRNELFGAFRSPRGRKCSSEHRLPRSSSSFVPPPFPSAPP